MNNKKSKCEIISNEIYKYLKLFFIIISFIITYYGIERTLKIFKIRDLSVETYIKILNTNNDIDKLFLLKYLSSQDENNKIIKQHILKIEKLFSLKVDLVIKKQELKSKNYELKNIASSNLNKINSIKKEIDKITSDIKFIENQIEIEETNIQRGPASPY